MEGLGVLSFETITRDLPICNSEPLKPQKQTYRSIGSRLLALCLSIATSSESKAEQASVLVWVPGFLIRIL